MVGRVVYVRLGVGRDDELAAQGLALFGCGAHEQIWALEDMVTSDSESPRFRAPWQPHLTEYTRSKRRPCYVPSTQRLT